MRPIIVTKHKNNVVIEFSENNIVIEFSDEEGKKDVKMDDYTTIYSPSSFRWVYVEPFIDD